MHCVVSVTNKASQYFKPNHGFSNWRYLWSNSSFSAAISESKPTMGPSTGNSLGAFSMHNIPTRDFL